MSTFRVINLTDGHVGLSGNYKVPRGGYIDIEVIKFALDLNFQSSLDAALLDGSVSVAYRDQTIMSSADILSVEDEVSPLGDIFFYVDPTSGGDDTGDGSFELPFATVDRALRTLASQNTVLASTTTIYIKQGTNPVREDIDLDTYNLSTIGDGRLIFEGYLAAAVVTGTVTNVPNTRQITDNVTAAFTAGMAHALLLFDGVGDPAEGHWRFLHTVVDADTVTFNRTTTSAAPVNTDAFSVYQPVVWTGAVSGAETTPVRDNGIVNKKGVNVVFKKIRFQYTKLQAIYQVNGTLWLENTGITNCGATGPVQGMYLNNVVAGGYNFWVNECTTGYYAVGGRHFWTGDFGDVYTTPSTAYEWSFTDCITTGGWFSNSEVIGAGALFINDDCASVGLFAMGNIGLTCGLYTEITDVDGDGIYLMGGAASFTGSTVNANGVGGGTDNIYAEDCDIRFTGVASDIGDCAGDHNLQMVGGNLQILNASRFDAAVGGSGINTLNTNIHISGAAVVDGNQLSNLKSIGGTVIVTAAATFDSSIAGSGIDVSAGSLWIVGGATTAHSNAVDGILITSGSGHIDGTGGALQNSNTGAGINFSGSHGQVTAVTQTGVNGGAGGIAISDISMVHDGGGNTSLPAAVVGANSVWAAI